MSSLRFRRTRDLPYFSPLSPHYSNSLTSLWTCQQTRSLRKYQFYRRILHAAKWASYSTLKKSLTWTWRRMHLKPMIRFWRASTAIHDMLKSIQASSRSSVSRTRARLNSPNLLRKNVNRQTDASSINTSSCQNTWKMSASRARKSQKRSFIRMVICLPRRSTSPNWCKNSTRLQIYTLMSQSL